MIGRAVLSDWDISLESLYSRLSLSRSPRDSLKYFEIHVPRHIRFAQFRKNESNKHISQMNL